MDGSIYIIDYIGNCDSAGNTTGHPVKIVSEYADLLKKDLNVSLVIPEIYKSKVNLHNIYSVVWLKYKMDMTAVKFTNKCKNIIFRIFNLFTIFRMKESAIFWFINIDFVLLMFLVLFPLKQNKTIWITTYLQKFAPSYSLKSRIKNFFYEQGIKRVHKIVTANRNLQFDAEKTVYIPGYFYDPKIYSRYQTTKKIIRVLCIGTMHETKDLEGIVEIFKKVNIPLLIVGKFHDEKRLHDLLGRAPDNVTIIDKYTTFDEYYKFISESKYVILPYKQEFYSRRTSGVLIETIFLGSIPIAPAFLLNFNNISGIAYNDMHELIDIINSGNNSSLTSCIEDYRVDSIKDRIINMVNTYR